ncbi:MAG TPA: D-alanyl-D-alanine carboxypeptidase/D-alanyl-D-alanine-endopeptidase [Burkholderiales bacterium]|nr:D-alanyl-D-alanine carboxypeptidase/D-alanyl-D-alanine-endopeptidase [Burkholderiales bacterium]
MATALAQAGIPPASIGLYVRDVESDRPLLMMNADRPLNPASAMKLVTTYAALSLLGPAYTWKTEIYSNTPPRNGVVKGDLIIKGYGDPQLTLEEFWLMLSELRQRGVRRIRGDLVLDHSYFQPAASDPARFDNEPARPYNTLPDAILVNYKAVRLEFIPNPERGSLTLLTAPSLPQVRVRSHIVLDNEPCGDWAKRLTHETADDGTHADLVLGGNYSLACGEQEREYSVLDHEHYVHALFTLLWRELGGSFNGGVHEGSVPQGAQPLVVHQSRPLAEIVRAINKFSNNVMARQLFLTLGAAGDAGPPGTETDATDVIQKWLAGRGLIFPELVLENGSGLSRSSQISAKDLGRLLLDAYRSPLMPELTASLPIVAVDGTMRKRLVDTSVAGQAHIKTGLLDNARSIAGYLSDAQGHHLVVVFMVNDPKAGAVQSAQDALLEWLYKK